MKIKTSIINDVIEKFIIINRKYGITSNIKNWRIFEKDQRVNTFNSSVIPNNNKSKNYLDNSSIRGKIQISNRISKEKNN